MGKKGRKTRWKKLPITIGNGTPGGGGGGSGGPRGGSGHHHPHHHHAASGHHQDDCDDERQSSAASQTSSSRITFNEDEYTKITTPRQDMLFKKGYLGRKKATPAPSQDTTDAQSADSVESEQYYCDEQVPQFMYPTPTGYIDQSGVYYVPNYEVYDPYTGGVTVVVGPAPGFPGAHPVLAALPCGPVPLQPVEWFAPLPPPPPPPVLPHSGYTALRKKSCNSIDSQNWSGQSSESTCPPGSPQDPTEPCEVQPYVYPGYMFGPPVYNVNGVSVQGVVPPPVTQPPSLEQSKRRKKRRRRRRGGVTDDGSESSCEEVCSMEAPGSSSSSSKTNSDSGIATDPCGTSGGQGSLSSLSNDEADKDNKSIPSEVESPICDVKEEALNLPPPVHKSSELSYSEPLISESNATEPPGIEPPSVLEQEPLECIDDEKTITSVEDTESPSSIEEHITKSDSTDDCVTTASTEICELAVSTELDEPAMSIGLDESPLKMEGAAGAQGMEDDRRESSIEETDVVSNHSVSPLTELESAEEVLPSDDSYGSPTHTSDDGKLEDTKNAQCSQLAGDKDEKIINEPTDVFSDAGFEERDDEDSSDESTLPYTADDQSIEESQTEVERLSTDLAECCLQNESGDLVSCFDEERFVSGFNDASMYDLDHLELEPDPPPVAPPRRKKCAEKVACKLSEEIVADAVSSAATDQRWPITSAVTKWLEDSEDEIEEAEEALTGQKNGEGNPFLAPYHSGAGTRVASNDWYNRRVREMCDPISSVNKYYRLALPMKTGPGPLPCGVCCIIQ